MNHLKATGKALETPTERASETSETSASQNSLQAGPTGVQTPEKSSLQNHQQRYLNEHSTCAMCDTKLEIRHDINKNDLKVKEEAHCPSCGIRVRSNHHLMH